MSAVKPLVAPLSKIDKNDIPLVGGKGANLGEMTQAHFPVPPGFAVTVVSYDDFLDQNNLRDRISEELKKVDKDKPDETARIASSIQKMIIAGKMPDEVAKEIVAEYKKLGTRFKKALVAARSSATAEDLPSASFAGQQATFLNVQGEASLLQSVKEAWASLFTARAIFYREENKINHNKVKISIIVQKMVESEVSGVMFSINPVTNEKDRIVIEAVWGLGEMIVQGSVVPDKYIVQKDTFAILSKEVSDQSVMLAKKGNSTKEMPVPKKVIDKQKITDEDIVELAKYAQKLQEHYYFPQDIEWAKEKDKLYIIQTRPVTTINAVKTKKEVKEGVKTAEAPVLSGEAASPGMGSGPVKILSSPKEIGKIKPGDILVAKMTSPDYVPAMKKAAAIITDEGGLTSHAAIVSRELGVPAVVGTQMATKKLKEGSIVTVDGMTGQVFLGANVKVTTKKPVFKEKDKHTKVRTATHVYVNLAEPELANKVSKRNVDGVGLLRAEFMIANIGIHPKEAIHRKTQGKFIDTLAKDLMGFCKSFYPRPVVYRATDFKTNEYRALPGGKHWEPVEPNPMLGFRGAFRYVANPEVFNLELQAIKKVRAKYNNLWLMVPFVRSPMELSKVRRMVATEGLFNETTFKFWMMVEVPVNVIKLADFLKVGVDGVSIGSNDLTMLLLGTDRDNSEVATAFNSLDPVVLWSLRRVIRTCHKYGVTASICGQAPSVYDELVEKLVKYGITSISVNPDAIERVRQVIADAERRILK